MCGIVGALAFGKLDQKDEVIRQRLMRFFTTELLILTEDRGKDATGAAVLFNNAHFVGVKRGEGSGDWLTKFGETPEYFGSLLKIWRTYNHPAALYIGHCRQGTIGDKEDNTNNHPIKVGPIIGVHNGVIKNHEEIIQHLGCQRDGRVDSEAIMRLFAHYTNNGQEPFTLDMCQNVVDRLDGEFAVMVCNASNPTQVPLFRDRRPIEFVLIKPFGILIVVSEIKFWNAVYFAYERLLHFNPDMIQKMPSLTSLGDAKQVDVDSLKDDHAVIFDLTKSVGPNTSLKDLCISARMERNNKKWMKPFKTETPQADSKVVQHIWPGSTENKKRHVWDPKLSKYVPKVGDIVIPDKSPVVVSVDKKVVSVLTSDGVLATKEVPKTNDTANSHGSGEGPETDSINETAMTPAATSSIIEDLTTYEPQDMQKSCLLLPEGEKPEKSVEVLVDEGGVVEVQKNLPLTEYVDAAYQDFLALPIADKGYLTMEELLENIEIATEPIAMSYGLVLIANRVFGMAWRKGHIAGAQSQTDEKAARRERHVADLKKLVLVLSSYINTVLKGTNDTAAHAIEKRIAAVASTFDSNFPNIAHITGIFNKTELGKVSRVFGILDNRSSYKTGETH